MSSTDDTDERVRLILDAERTSFVSAGVEVRVTPAAIDHSLLLSELREQPDTDVDMDIPLPRHVVEAWVECAECARQDTASISHIGAASLLDAVEVVNRYFHETFSWKPAQGSEAFDDTADRSGAIPSDAQRARVVKILTEVPPPKALSLLAPPPEAQPSDANCLWRVEETRARQLRYSLQLLPVPLHPALLRAWFPSIDADASLSLSGIHLRDIRRGYSHTSMDSLTALILAAAALSGGRPDTVWAPSEAEAGSSASGAQAEAHAEAVTSKPPRKRVRNLKAVQEAGGRPDHMLCGLLSDATPDCGDDAQSALDAAAAGLIPSSPLTRLELSWVGRDPEYNPHMPGMPGAPPSWYDALGQVQQLRHFSISEIDGLAHVQVPQLMEAVAALPELCTFHWESLQSAHKEQEPCISQFLEGLGMLTGLSMLLLDNCFQVGGPAPCRGPIPDAIAGLSRLTRLTRLRLQFKADIGIEWAHLFVAPVIAMTGLQHLCLGERLQGAYIAAGACEGGSLKALRHLDINKTDACSWERLAACVRPGCSALTGLTALAVTGSGDAAGNSKMFDLISRLPLLRSLNIAGLQCRGDRLSGVAAALPHLRALTELWLGRNAAVGLCAVLEGARKLEEGGGMGLRVLVMGLHSIMPHDTERLAACILQLQGLERLRVAGAWDCCYPVELVGVGDIDLADPAAALSDVPWPEFDDNAENADDSGTVGSGGDGAPLLKVLRAYVRRRHMSILPSGD